VRNVDAILNEHEPKLKMAPGGVKLLIAIESPRGLLNAPAIAACSPRVCGLMFGAEDFGRELGLPTSREGEARDMLYARSAMVIAAAAAHVQAIDGVWVDLKDPEGLVSFARQSRRLGFSGMSSIHPSQIDPINSHFSPTADEINYAREVVKAFEEANARGDGSIAFGGQLIDRPIVERARRTLELANQLGMGAKVAWWWAIGSTIYSLLVPFDAGYRSRTVENDDEADRGKRLLHGKSDWV